MNELSKLNNTLLSFNPLEQSFLDESLKINKEGGVDPTVENAEGKTAIKVAEDRGIEELARFLEKM